MNITFRIIPDPAPTVQTSIKLAGLKPHQAHPITP